MKKQIEQSIAKTIDSVIEILQHLKDASIPTQVRKEIFDETQKISESLKTMEELVKKMK
jgi:uncharacterized protein (UPF0147 family)